MKVSPTDVSPTDNDYSKRFKLAKLTSDVFGPSNPPKDWADASLLVPHEALRMEMNYMIKSVDKLSELSKVEFRAILELCDEHEELEEMAEGVASICKTIVSKTGYNCNEEVEELKTKTHSYVFYMKKEHMAEEEEEIPPLAKKVFTEAEAKKIQNKIFKRSKLSATRKFSQSILISVAEWSTPEYYGEFRKEISGPVLHVMEKYYRPDFDTNIKPKRDAPFLQEEPILSRRKWSLLYMLNT